MDVRRGNVMILRVNRVVARFFPYSFSPSFFILPLLFLFHFFGLSRASFFHSRSKTAQLGFRDKKEKATARFCILEIILSWRIAMHVGFGCFPLFFLQKQTDISWLKFCLSISVDAS